MTELATLLDPTSVRFERRLPGSLDQVWAYLVDGKKRALWLAGGDDIPSVAGQRFTLRFDHQSLSPRSAPVPARFEAITGGISFEYELLRIDPPRSLTMTWGGGSEEPSEVTFELQAADDTHVRLIITHRRLADRATLHNVAGGWHTHLGVLQARLEDREPEPFWNQFLVVEELYRALFADTKPAPPRLVPFLMFQGGKAEEALRFYVATIPGSELLELQLGEANAADGRRSVRMAQASLGGLAVRCIDSDVPHAFEFTPSLSLFFTCRSEEEIDHLAATLGEGGTQLMALGDHGFSRKFAWVNDRFGVSWQLNLP